MESVNNSLDTIFYKQTYVKKHNTYTWCGIVDKNGRMLKFNLLNQLIDEFVLHITECTQSASDMFMDEHMFKLGINTHFHNKFFKLVSPSLCESYLLPYKKERGRYKNEHIYLFYTIYDAFYNVETFFNGVLWLFTSLQHLKDYIGFIDRCRILRVNHDFVKMFGEDKLEPLSFDEIISTKMIQYDNLKSSESEKLKNISINKRQRKTEEYWSNGIKIIKEDAEYKDMKIPDIYDYHYEIFKKKSSLQTNTNKVITPIKKERTVSRNKLNLILR